MTCIFSDFRCISVHVIGVVDCNCPFLESLVLLVETLDDPTIFGLFNNSCMGLGVWAMSGI